MSRRNCLFLVLVSLIFATLGVGEANAITATGGTVTNFTNATGTYMVHTFTSNGTFTVTGSGNVEYLVIAGGGGGGAYYGGGGGAGGLLRNDSYAVTPTAYTVIIGNGGTGAALKSSANGNNGRNSSFGNISAMGGGGGAGYSGPAQVGGSGGGGNGYNSAYTYANGIPGQGNRGGNGANYPPYPCSGGGGGGAGAVGATGATDGGNGGNGLAHLISGSSVYYAGGGGGAGCTGAKGNGGNGGGGNGGADSGPIAVSGTANTGGGGGGGDWIVSPTAGNGGSGIVIISYLIPKPEFNVTSCGSLTVQGGKYFLIANITNYAAGTCIIIDNSSITFNGNGNRIDGIKNATSAGIYVPSSGNSSVISNVILTEFYNGVYLSNSANITIANSTSYNNSQGGFRIDSALNNNIINSTVYLNGVGGFWLSSSSNNTITNSIAHTSDTGFYLSGSSSNNTITYSTAHNNTGSGFLLEATGPNNKIVNSISYNNGGIGFYLYSTNNNIIDNSTTYSNSGRGFYMYSSANNNTITNSISRTNTDSAVAVAGSINNRFINNIFNGTAISSSATNLFNSTLTSGTNLVGGANTGGNYWTNPAGNGYSDICVDADANGICDSPYVDGNITDSLPLAKYVPPPPNVTLSSPSSSYSTSSFSTAFSCNATDAFGLSNITLKIWDSSSSLIYSNTSPVSGTSNSTSWSYTFSQRSNYSWNCLAYGTSGSSAYSSANRTLMITEGLRATGGTITTILVNGTNYTIHTFTSSGTFNATGSDSVEYLVVAGGGGGGGAGANNGGGGGGGAGGLIYNSAYPITVGNYTIIVGGVAAGGIGNADGSDGQNSSFGSLIAVGGGGGLKANLGAAGRPGGSGGGVSYGIGGAFGGAGISGQGNRGGNSANGNNIPGTGGGGAGAPGGDVNSSAGVPAGAGGVGLAYSIRESSTYYAGGGGGGQYPAGTNGAAGGLGGGGAGGQNSPSSGTAGTANTGGGGGGASSSPSAGANGGNGGSGIVIIKYLTFLSSLDATPPTVTLSSPSSGSRTPNLSISFSCNAVDSVGLSNITLKIWNSSNSQIYSNTSAVSGNTNSSSWSYTFIQKGNFAWNCLAYDNSSNYAWSASNATLTIQKYAKLQILTPQDGSSLPRGKNGPEDIIPLNKVVDNMSILAQITENESGTPISGAQCGLSIDSSSKGASTTNSSGHCIFSYDRSNGSLGAHQISLNISSLSLDYIASSLDYNSTFNLDNWTMKVDINNYRMGIGAFYYNGDLALVNVTVMRNGALANVTGIWFVMTDGSDNSLVELGMGNFTQASTGVYQTEIIVPSGLSWVRWKAVVSSDFPGQDSNASSNQHTDVEVHVAPIASINMSMVGQDNQPLVNSSISLYRIGELGRYSIFNQTLSSGTSSVQKLLIQNDSGYDLEIKTPDSNSILISNFNLSAGLNFATQQANFSDAKPNQTRYVSSVLASNATSFSISTLTFVKTFEPTSICSCQNWSFVNSNCSGTWVCNSTLSYSYASNSTHFWFNVTHFTGYALGQSDNENLTIWDETDSGMQFGNQIRYISQNIRFFANYSNSTSEPITGADCSIWFSDSGWNSMAWNSTNLYEYTRSFTSGGSFDWNVSCNKTGQVTLTSNDTVIVNSTTVVVLNSPADALIQRSSNVTFNWTPYGFPGDPSCNITRNGSVIHISSCTNNEPCVYSNTTANGYYIWNITCNSGETTRESSTRTLTVNTIYRSSTAEGILNMNITEISSISLPQNTISFGTVEITQTYDSYPSKFFVIKNDGNTIVDIEVNATNPFFGSNCTFLPCSSYQVKVGANSTTPYPICSANPSKINYTNMYGSSSGLLINDLNFVDNDDSANIYIKYVVPSDEPPGSKSSIVTFWAKSANSYECG